MLILSLFLITTNTNLKLIKCILLDYVLIKKCINKKRFIYLKIYIMNYNLFNFQYGWLLKT